MTWRLALALLLICALAVAYLVIACRRAALDMREDDDAAASS